MVHLLFRRSIHTLPTGMFCWCHQFYVLYIYLEAEFLPITLDRCPLCNLVSCRSI